MAFSVVDQLFKNQIFKLVVVNRGSDVSVDKKGFCCWNAELAIAQYCADGWLWLCSLRKNLPVKKQACA